MGQRVTEIGHDAIALYLRHEALEALDSCDTRLVVARENAAILFRVARVGKCRRANKIAEQHRDLPALTLCRHRFDRGSGWSGGGFAYLVLPALDRQQDPLPVAKRNPQLVEVLLAERGQNLQVDIVAVEGLSVLRETVRSQPLTDGLHVAHESPPAAATTPLVTSPLPLGLGYRGLR